MPASRHDHNPHPRRLRNQRLDHRLLAQPREPLLRPLDRGNLVYVLQADRAHGPQRRVALLRVADMLLPLGAFFVVPRARRVACAAQLALDLLDARRAQEQDRRRRRARLEVEAAVRADGDAGGDRDAGGVDGGARVEFLAGELACAPFRLERRGFLAWGAYFAKVHALDAFAAERGADGRGRRGLPGAHYEFDDHIFL
jgi:hypothetical protein